jgi:hypothetical protein
MKRRRRSTHHLAEQAALRLRELIGAPATGERAPERHSATLLFRRPPGSPAFQSHLYFELDGEVTDRFQAAFAARFARRLEQARREPGSAFCMLADDDPDPTLQWSLEHPARARVDIHTTGGARLWAFERLVQHCFEQSIRECAVASRVPFAARDARARYSLR